MSKDAEVLEFLELLEKEAKSNPNDAIVPPGQRPCPICQQKMSPSCEYGITLDVCEEHGIWFDRGELQAIVSSIRSNDLVSGREAIEKAKREGKLDAMFLGSWSLLLD